MIPWFSDSGRRLRHRPRSLVILTRVLYLWIRDIFCPSLSNEVTYPILRHMINQRPLLARKFNHPCQETCFVTQQIERSVLRQIPLAQVLAINSWNRSTWFRNTGIRAFHQLIKIVRNNQVVRNYPFGWMNGMINFEIAASKVRWQLSTIITCNWAKECWDLNRLFQPAIDSNTFTISTSAKAFIKQYKNLFSLYRKFSNMSCTTGNYALLRSMSP